MPCVVWGLWLLGFACFDCWLVVWFGWLGLMCWIMFVYGGIWEYLNIILRGF